MTDVFQLPIGDPTLIFLVVLLVILFAPIIMGKLRIPHIIGLVLSGVLIGEYGLNIIARDDSFELFGRIGLYYIMFLAALEMDIYGLRKILSKVGVFGALTFFVPFILMYVTSTVLLGYSPKTSMLLSAIMASNTLVAYPIVLRYGLQKKPSVTLSVGGSMIALLFALVVLAAIVASHNGHDDVLSWLWFWGKLVLFIVFLLLVIPRCSRWFLRTYSDAVMQFIFVMVMVCMSAAMSALIGFEGIVGAFLAGLIMNRYIPHVSPLMNRIEFVGNAIFIPYFLIGVGMLINLRLLFEGGYLLVIALVMVLVGTVGKALAAYLANYLFRLPLSSGHMMFGLTSAHAAGAIAMVMVGINIVEPDGSHVITDDMLNGVICMILFTCIISSMVTEVSARRIVMRDKEMPKEDDIGIDDEKILLPVKYPEYANHLVDLAVLMRNERLGRGLVALNVVYDDDNMRTNQAKGRQLLEQVTQHAAGSDVRMQGQVRVAANIANGIKHAFQEFQASEIIIGIHQHKENASGFWGKFHQSLFNGLNRQIIMARIHQSLNTIRKIQVGVPSKAQYEPGFYRWLERLARMASRLDCRIVFHGREDTLGYIRQFMRSRHANVRSEYSDMEHWNQMPEVATTVAHDHMFVVVTARKNTVSYKNAMERLPDELEKHFNGKNLMIIFPDQYGDAMNEMTFAQPQHTEEKSAYGIVHRWIKRKIWKILKN